MSSVIRFLDRSGFSWSVFELRAGNSADPENSLYFLSRGSTLRLHSYPDDWPELDWAGLDRLRLTADVISDDVTRHATPRRRTPQLDSATAL